jgi:hypothetical protein
MRLHHVRSASLDFIVCVLALLLLGIPSRALAQATGRPTNTPSLMKIAATYDQAPGEAAGVFDTRFSYFALDGSGLTAYFGGIGGLPTPNYYGGGIWVGFPPNFVAFDQGYTSTTPAPGTVGATFFGFGGFGLSSDGHITIEAIVSGGDVKGTINNSGLWTGAPNALHLLFRQADPAPQTSGATFASFSTPVMNSSGLTAFQGTLLFGANVIYTANLSSNLLLARTGSSIAGLGADNFGFLTNPAISTDGSVVFEGTMTGGDVNGTTNNAAIFLAAPAGLPTVVVRKGVTLAPGTGGGVFSALKQPAINDAGQIAFIGSASGGNAIAGVNDSGVWEGLPSALNLVKRKGDAAPGTIDTFKTFLASPAIDPSGMIAFLASLNGADVVSTNQDGLWYGAPDNLNLIVRDGEDLYVNATYTDPGTDTRTVQSIDSIVTIPNAVYFHIVFTDGSDGIFSAAVPEPTSLAILGLGSGMLLLRRRRIVL